MLVVRRMVAVLAVGAASLALGTLPAEAHTEASPTCASATVLSPRNEVRTSDADPVDSRAFGFAAIKIKGTTLTYAVAIANPARETFVAGHIHAAAAGANGGVVVELFSGMSNRRVFTQLASIQITQAQADAICGNLTGHYINYHTTQDPQGAVRGQLN